MPSSAPIHTDTGSVLIVGMLLLLLAFMLVLVMVLLACFLLPVPFADALFHMCERRQVGKCRLADDQAQIVLKVKHKAQI